MGRAVLEGMRVVDLGDFASGPYCTKVLADLGAEVVKVEPPEGDSARRYGPFPGDTPDLERSGLHLWLNAGKRSVVVDQGTQAGRDRLDALLAGADIAVISADLDGRAPCEQIRELAARHPHLVLVAITPFGLEGKYADWAGYDLNVAAMSGLAYGAEGRAPLVPAALQIYLLAGLGAAYTTLAGLLAREAGAGGQLIDLALTQFMAVHSAQRLPSTEARPGPEGAPLRPKPELARPRTQYPAHVLRCADGQVFLYAPQIQQWIRFVQAMGEPEWTKEPRFRNRLAMSNEYQDETDALVEEWMRQRSKEELLDVFMEFRVPGAPILDARDVVESAHLREREFFLDLDLDLDLDVDVDADRSGAGPARVPGLQFRMERSPLANRGPAPALDGDRGAAWPARPGAALPPPAEGRRAGRPLEGVRIVDFGTVMVGGLASRLLAELGAEVIKVESHVSLDGYRIGHPTLGSEAQRADESLRPEMQAGFHSLHRNKRGITINMNQAEGVELLKRLIGVSDVVMENFSPGVLARRGLDYASLREANPDLIFISMPGAGSTGPLRNYATYAWTVEALVGMTSINGYEDGELVGHLAMPWGDVVNATSGALAALAAVLHRRRTGEGQFVESAQLEAFAAIMGEPYLEYVLTGRIPVPRGNASPVMAPHQCYPVAGGRWVAICVRSDEEWQAFCRASGNESWADDPRFDTLAARRAHLAELDEAIAAWTRGRTSEQVVLPLQRAGVAATPVLDLDDQVADRYFHDRAAFVEMPHPLFGDILVPGLTAKLAGELLAVGPSPLMGQDNDYVFGELLGLPAEERQRLADEQVIY